MSGVFRKIGLATAILDVDCSALPVSEHMWAYFEYSYNPTFKLPAPWPPTYDVHGNVAITGLPKARNNLSFAVTGTVPAGAKLVSKHATFIIENGKVVVFDKDGEATMVIEPITDGDPLIRPATAGAVTVGISENRFNFEDFVTTHPVIGADYERPYTAMAGLVMNAKFTPTTPPTAIANVPPLPLYARCTIAKV